MKACFMSSKISQNHTINYISFQKAILGILLMGHILNRPHDITAEPYVTDIKEFSMNFTAWKDYLMFVRV